MAPKISNMNKALYVDSVVHMACVYSANFCLLPFILKVFLVYSR